MGTFGFSYIGLLFLLMLFVPNLTWTKHTPKGYSAEKENKFLLVLERAGQIGVTCFVLAFSNFNLHGWSLWSLWLAVAFAIMLLYECWWVRYFKSEKTMRDFYSSFLGVPVAGATLSVAAFFLLSIYGKVWLLAVSVIILGVGHIGIHLQHAKEWKQ